MQPIPTTAQLFYQLPLLILVAGGSLLLIVEAFARSTGRRWVMQLSVLTTVVALLATWIVWKDLSGTPASLFDGMLVVDRFSLFFTAVFLITALLTSLLSADFLEEHAVLYGEFYPLILFSTAGMVMVAMASDLVTLFLGIETMSLGAYVLTGSFRRAKRSSEAAMKYFLTGAFATAFFIYGIALVYGTSGATNLDAIQKAVAAHKQPLFIVGELMIILAVGFKIAAVPFHMWAPDAYEGAPTPVTGFMAAGIKAAGFAAVLRLFLSAFNASGLPWGNLGWTSIFSVLAVLTMSIGNLAALRQENVKRLLAYSSIAHAGYLLVGVVAAGMQAKPAVPALLYYLLAYSFTTLGAFGVVAWIGSRGDERPLVDDWAGLAQRHPAAALAMTIFMLSLGGFPPTAGFFGKFYVFRAAMDVSDQLLWLIVVSIINSLVSVFYYLRLVMAMYFRESTREPRPLRSGAVTTALAVCVLLVLGMGLFPGSWLGWAADASLVPQAVSAPPVR